MMVVAATKSFAINFILYCIKAKIYFVTFDLMNVIVACLIMTNLKSDGDN